MSEKMLFNRRQLLSATARLSALASFGALASSLPAFAASTAGAAQQAFIDSIVAKGLAPGGVMAMGEGDSRPQFASAGKLAFDGATAVDSDTLWRIYSQTKPITGIAAMMLIGEGKLKLDQPVADFIPAFGQMRVLVDPDHSLEARPATQTMTIRHLLTHTAGLGYTSVLNKGPLVDEYRRLGLTAGRASRSEALEPGRAPTAPSLAEFAKRLATMPLIAEPGTKWSYSCALDLLARIIEIASGAPFDEFLARRLFVPLGMNSTYFRVPDSERGRLATSYQLDGQTLSVLDPGPTSIFFDPPAFPFGGSGLVSSARDYDRFLAMLANRGTFNGTRILAPETAMLGMSNLLPEGVDITMLKQISMGGHGFGAGGSVELTGPAKGAFGWIGAAGTAGQANPVNGRRASGYINVMGQFALAAEVTKAIA